jgi:6-phosphofructo-2-kinase/fructose-2,6-biphosphatase
MTNARKIWLTRHGESQYNQQGLIGGDSRLSPTGEHYAHVLPNILLERVPRVSGAARCCCRSIGSPVT